MAATLTVGSDLASIGTNLSTWLATDPFSLEFMSSLSTFLPDTSDWRPQQLSTTQLVFSMGSNVVVIQGSGMALNGGLSALSTGTLGNFLDNISGTVTSAELVTNGAYSPTHGTVTGTTVASATFSATQWQITSPNSDGETQTVTISGTDLPTGLTAVTQILDGTYAGSAIAISGITLVGPNQTESISLSSTLMKIDLDGYELDLAGSSLPNSLTAGEIDGTQRFTFNSVLTGATLTNLGTGQVDASITGLGAGVAVGLAADGTFTGFGDLLTSGTLNGAAYTGNITESIQSTGGVDVNDEHFSDAPIADLIGGSGTNTIDISSFGPGSDTEVNLAAGTVSNGLGGTQGLQNFKVVELAPFFGSPTLGPTIGGLVTGDIIELDLPTSFVTSVTKTPSSFTVEVFGFLDSTYGVTGSFGSLTMSADANGNTDLTFKAVTPPTEFVKTGKGTAVVGGAKVFDNAVESAAARGFASEPAAGSGGPAATPGVPGAGTDGQVALLAAAVATLPASTSSAAAAAQSSPQATPDNPVLTEPSHS
jgi:hypothetical protein